jgi:integrase
MTSARKWATMIEGQAIAGKHFPQKKSQHTLNELLDKYEQDIMPRKTRETQLAHQSVIAFWRKRLGYKFLSDITREDIIHGRNELSKGRKPATVVKYLVLITHSLNIAIKEYGWLDKNVASTVSRPTLPPNKVRFLADEERSRLLSECRKSQNKHLYALVSLAMYTGLRRGALLNLMQEDIDLKNKTITIGKTKNKSTLILPLVRECYELVKGLCSQNTGTPYIFPAHAKYRWNSYEKAFNEAVKRANLTHTNFSFHSLRHTAASYMIQAGIPLYTVGAVLNHKNPAQITHRYAHLHTDQLRDALEVLAQRLSS